MGERTPKATDTDGLLLGYLGPDARIGPYVIDTQLPTRGSGHLYLGAHLMLPRSAILKVMPAVTAAGRELAVELLREACILDALDHPGVPRLFETGLMPDRRPWVAVEHVDGTSLATALDSDAIDVDSTLAIVRDVADILAHVHAHGVAHGNVVPSAIVVPARSRRHPLCLVDWGSSRTADSTRPLPLAPPQASMGYLAPEQLHGQALDGKSDVYALGMLARELGADVHSELPPLFIALVERMLASDPADRPTSAEVRDASRWLCEQHGAPPYTFARSRRVTSETTPTASGELRVQR